MDTSRTVDVSPEELDRINRRRQIRQSLKAEFNRTVYNPYRQVYRIELHDPAVERFMAARSSRYEFIKPTWRSFITYFGLLGIPMVATMYFMRMERLERERRYRGGLIPYAEQTHKTLRVPQNLHQMP